MKKTIAETGASVKAALKSWHEAANKSTEEKINAQLEAQFLKQHESERNQLSQFFQACKLVCNNIMDDAYDFKSCTPDIEKLINLATNYQPLDGNNILSGCFADQSYMASVMKNMQNLATLNLNDLTTDHIINKIKPMLYASMNENEKDGVVYAMIELDEQMNNKFNEKLKDNRNDMLLLLRNNKHPLFVERVYCEALAAVAIDKSMDMISTQLIPSLIAFKDHSKNNIKMMPDKVKEFCKQIIFEIDNYFKITQRVKYLNLLMGKEDVKHKNQLSSMNTAVVKCFHNINLAELSKIVGKVELKKGAVNKAELFCTKFSSLLEGISNNASSFYQRVKARVFSHS
jgi:hypothetical protein